MPDDQSKEAFGQPGLSPTWASGAKDGIGTAYSVATRLWYTVWKGIVTEVYYPTVDRPNTRDLQYMFANGESVEDEVSMETTIETIGDSLGYLVKGKGSNFSYEKEIISDPHLPCLLQRTKILADQTTLQTLKVYALCAPHLGVAGRENHAEVMQFLGRKTLVANNRGTWLAMAADRPFSKASVGYVGASDGWTDVHQHHAMEWEFDTAASGNVALTGEIDLSQSQEFTLGVAFGDSRHRALATLSQSLAPSYASQRENFLDQWSRTKNQMEDLDAQSGDGGLVYQTSMRLLLAHEDKLNPGAMVASLAIPWGDVKGDEDGAGGYHLVWTRDMVQSAMGLLAAGKQETPLRALIYLAASQKDDGSFAQNFWVDGDPFWTGLQQDEVAFPILLGHRLWKESLLGEFSGKEMVLRAVRFLIKSGPITKQERWEETGGFSPSTLAAVIAALICAADASRSNGHEEPAVFIEQYADWIERNIERWTVTHEGSLLPEVKSHYVRIAPAQPGDVPPENVRDELLELTSRYPDAQTHFPAKEIVDGGFLELVRYGIRAADDPIIVDSLKVVDAHLKVESESGTMWRRYNNDGYGQQDDGSPYTSYGKGRGWPLLTGERGHYEIAAGRDAGNYIRWMEALATPTRLIPEQSWDLASTPDGSMKNGRPTGSAVPLLWAHAEYVKLLRSARDGKVFDLIPEVADRYLKKERQRPFVDIWSFACPIGSVAPGHTLSVLANAEFDLRFSLDDWASSQQMEAKGTPFEVFHADVDVPVDATGVCRFTFYWRNAEVWENRDFEVAIRN